MSRPDNCFLSNQHDSLSESEAYKFCECEGRACDGKKIIQKDKKPQDRNGAEQNFVIRRRISLARS